MASSFSLQRLAVVLAILSAEVLLAGCGGSHKTQAKLPPPPSIEEPNGPDSSDTPSDNAQSEAEGDSDAASVSPKSKPLFTEVGLASWYGPPYHNRRGSNGEVYNMHAMTAAHRTLPLGSVVRVTNVKTKHSAVVRITDRGPFIEGRILDLSLAAAKKIDVWAPGTAKVKLEVLSTPAALDHGGRWAVQIGAFEKEHQADELADHLTRRYHSAKILRFSSPVGDWWVRVRVKDDDRKRAEEVARDTRTSEGAIFLVRLD